jgi:putative ATP-binding cassette transporter
VQSALSFFVTSYRSLAEWRAVVARLDGFEMSIASATTLATSANAIDVISSTGSDEIDLRQLLVRLPNGTPLISADSFSIHSHERTLVTGPSGAGKSTLFRAVAGIWPFGNGSIAIPANASLMMLPQRPYFPIGPLRAAIVYPSEADAFSPEQVGDTLVSVGLPRLA